MPKNSEKVKKNRKKSHAENPEKSVAFRFITFKIC